MVSQRTHGRQKAISGLHGGIMRTRLLLVCGLIAALLPAGACGGSRKGRAVKLPPPVNPRLGWSETGVASWYGYPYHGRTTSNGEVYDMNKMTAAHNRLPFDTWVRVRNLSNGLETQVRINDRGPFVGKRIIDLSRSAATAIQLVGPGTARVRLTVIRPPNRATRRASGQRGQPRQPPSRSGRGQFDIQIGVFAVRENAEALVSKVRNWGHRANIRVASPPAGTRYFVIVVGGRRDQATSRMRRLKQRGVEGFLRPRAGN